ncbi:MAG TPA: hypothetical protein QGF58_25620 [Myxococcota bacterium]|nr:hypothetical protein [Myxococcota bacterium]
MADPKKGFDPLASLFDGPDLRDFSGAGSPLPEVDESIEFTDPSPEATDPLISMPVDGLPLETLKGSEPGSSPAPAPIPPRARAEMPSALEPPEPAALEPTPIAPSAEPDAAEDAPTEEGPTSEDKAKLAKALAAAALAKAQEKQKIEGLAKAESKRRRSIPPPPEMAEPEAPKSRLEGLAARAPRPVSALEAARAAASAEAARKEAADVAHLLELPNRIDKILRRQLKGIRTLDVVNALLMDDRPLLQALWKGHRARFAATGSLSEVVATTNVIRALGAVPKGQLVAAIVETEKTDYLVWVDLGSEATIAAFPDARAWYAHARDT